MSLILNAVKEVFFSFTPNRCQYEAMMKFDFKIDDPRQNLMQLSFSAFSNWPLLIILFLIYLNPLKSFWSLQSTMQSFFGDASAVRFFLLDGQLSSMGIFFGVFFFLEWILRKEYLLIALVFFFLCEAELHVHLALSALFGVYLARSLYLWWFGIDLESGAQNIWRWVTSLQLGSTVLVSLFSLYVLDALQKFHLLSTVDARTEFILLIVILFQFINFLFLSLWGHFSFQKKNDPSFIPIHYSTAGWILRFKMSFLVKKKLKEKTSEVLKSHQDFLVQIKEMKDQSLGLKMAPLEDMIHQELAYLQTAASRLTVG